MSSSQISGGKLFHKNGAVTEKPGVFQSLLLKILERGSHISSQVIQHSGKNSALRLMLSVANIQAQRVPKNSSFNPELQLLSSIETMIFTWITISSFGDSAVICFIPFNSFFIPLGLKSRLALHLLAGPWWDKSQFHWYMDDILNPMIISSSSFIYW